MHAQAAEDGVAGDGECVYEGHLAAAATGQVVVVDELVGGARQLEVGRRVVRGVRRVLAGGEGRGASHDLERGAGWEGVVDRPVQQRLLWRVEVFLVRL